MPMYVYEGPGTSLSIAGRTLDRGQPTALEGRAAEAAASHPQVHSFADLGAASHADAPTGLGRYAALKARAKELGLSATGKADDLEAAIEAEEARLADGGAD